MEDIATIERVLTDWFGTDASPGERETQRWFGHSADTDRDITARFGGLIDAAADGALDPWLQTPRGRLAAIIVIDQFSRNVHRGTPRAFERDPLALGWTLDGLERGVDRSLRPIERVFFYLPLEHSESAEMQRLSVDRFEALQAEVDAAGGTGFAGFTDFARRHRDVICRFGRFPHRNAILGRTSTAAEQAFLDEPGSSF